MASKRRLSRRKASPGGTAAGSPPAKVTEPEELTDAPPGEDTAPIPIPLNPASLARRKASLIAELRSPELTPGRKARVEAELAAEPLASTPILSPEELRRLGSA